MTGGLPAQESEDEGEEGIEKKQEEALPAKRSQDRRLSPPSRTLSSPRASSPRLSTPPPKPRATNRSRKSSPAQDETSALPVQDAHISDEESSLLDPSLLTFGSLDSDSPAHGTCPPSAIKVGATPAHETSILALTNFKRRARQPSLLRMVHQTTDVEDNNDYDDLDDFEPDDESTPLQNRKVGGEQVESESPESTPPSAGSRGTKRKLKSPSPVVQVPRSSPPCEPASAVESAVSQRSSSPSLPEPPIGSCEAGNIQKQGEPEPLSETMAPPRSSSPTAVDEESEIITRKEPVKRTRQTKSSSKQTSRAPGISTAKLQALLPRRRIRAAPARSGYNFQDSDDADDTPIDSDQDELQMPQRYITKARKATAKPKTKTARTAKKSSAATGRVKKGTKTYTRRTSSDKENANGQAASDDSTPIIEPTETSFELPAPNLAAIAKKFEDVDAFEMEFESVDGGGGESSPWR